MVYNRKDMEGQFYKWNTGRGAGMFSGRPSRRLFDRYNGDQVLFIINFYASFFENFTLEDGRRLERRLTGDLPLEAKSEISVFNWMKDGSADPIH